MVLGCCATGKPPATAEFRISEGATALFSRFLAEQLDEMGLDFAIIYPTGGLRVSRFGADKPRRAAARAYNIVTAEYFGPFADRMRSNSSATSCDAGLPDGPAGRGGW